MDQTNVYFEAALKTTIAKRGSRQVRVAKRGNSKRATINLAVGLDGTKLPAYTIFAFERKGLVAKNEIPVLNNMFGQLSLFGCQKKGWCDKVTMLDWIRLVWAPFARSKAPLPLLLMLDQHPVHKMAEISAALSALNTILVLLPAGETSRVQVLDVGINRPFKAHMEDFMVRHIIESLATEGQEETQENEAKAKFQRRKMAQFISQSWRMITSQTIVNTYRHVGITIQ
jgi:hypothetical protein